MNAQTITRAHNLADLAVTRAGASRVFHRHGLDFCCNGRVSLEQACGQKGLDVDALIDEIQREELAHESFDRWDEAALESLIEHLLTHFHEAHRAEVPRLVEMAHKVESVHGDKASCPKGLAQHLEKMHEELELHMQKEEEVLFPLIRSGRGPMAAMPVQMMEQEHRDHGANLARMRELAHGYEPPEEACGTWRALYLGLAELESELMHHIHLENNVLFPRALRG
jgi:regulator of cell morphogenesis and NO signaling